MRLNVKILETVYVTKMFFKIPITSDISESIVTYSGLRWVKYSPIQEIEYTETSASRR